MGMRLERLTISAYRDGNFKYKDGNDFVVWMNPQSYKRTLSIRTKEKAEVNSPAPSPTYMKVGDETLDFKLIFDTTGLVLSPLGSEIMPEDGVMALIEPLIEKIAKVPQGRKHPNFVLLSWAQLQAKCVLTSMSITYKLFRPDGTAIRAEVDMAFKIFTSAITFRSYTDTASEKVPEYVTVLQGDTLPALCARIYGDSSYYIDVARFNQIFSFRRLKTGTQLIFPPLAQLS
ncbi:MAG: hypothetical protein RLZZ117_2273 [Cyanobacteriota bacterium]|jgi:hypothetical protein